jgi:uncharacterized protein (DUF1800 family)
MRRKRFRVLLIVVAVALLAAATAAETARTGEGSPLRLPETSLSERQRIVHAVNRFGYGPRPIDVERIRRIGLETWLTRQLHPQRIADAEVDRRLSNFSTSRMSQVELLTAYPPPQLLRGIVERFSGVLEIDPAELRALFPELEELERARQERDGEGKPANAASRGPTGMSEPRMLDGPGLIGAELSQAKLIRAVYSERQLEQVMTDFWFNHFNAFIGKGQARWMITGYERDAIRPHVLGRFRDLLGAVARHPAMLFYLDNWLSSDPEAVLDGVTLQLYAVESIADHELPPGGITTLILRDRGMDTDAIERQLAQRESWLRYKRLRNRGRRRDDPFRDPQTGRRGLNENYARELLELHTLGVDGGYTQQDVIEVARCFTGWTLTPLHAGRQFVFVPELHDRGKKVVLGTKIKGRGLREGEAVLDLLARHPSTARFISTKLAVRFVGDAPPASLVERMSRTFLASDGDIREVMRTLILSEEFWSSDAFEAKLKTPFELVVSAVRALEGEIAPMPVPPREVGMAAMDRAAMEPARPPGLLQVLNQLSQPLYRAQPPTGYDDTAEGWVSTGALLDRMKFSLGLVLGRIPGVEVEIPERMAPDELGLRLLGRPPSDATLSAIERQLALGPEELAALGLPRRLMRSERQRSRLAAGWLLASAEFQRR